MGYNMSLNKIDIYMETNTKIEYKKYTNYKATLYLKTILLKNVFLKRSEWMAGIAEDLFLKLCLDIFLVYIMISSLFKPNKKKSLTVDPL